MATVYAEVKSNLGTYEVSAGSRAVLRLNVKELVSDLRQRGDRDIRVRYVSLREIEERTERELSQPRFWGIFQ